VIADSTENLECVFGWHHPAHESLWLSLGVVDIPVDTGGELIWAVLSADLVVPIAGADFVEADLIAVTFPIEINAIKVSSEGFLSQFLEIAYKFIEFFWAPIFFHGEICAPRRQSKSNCNTFLL